MTARVKRKLVVDARVMSLNDVKLQCTFNFYICGGGGIGRRASLRG